MLERIEKAGLDDYIRDGELDKDESTKDAVSDWLRSIETELQIILRRQNAEVLWEVYHRQYEDAYVNFHSYSLYDGVINKCNLAFLIFDLPTVCSNNKRLSLKQLFQDFLFMLQLIDDFHDMEEDKNAPRNHNLHLFGLGVRQQNNMMRNRALVLPSLLKIIDDNISSFRSIENRLIRQYVSNIFNWIRLLQKKYCFELVNVVYSDSFKDFTVYSDCIYLNSDSIKLPFMLDMNDVLAERVHTFSWKYE